MLLHTFVEQPLTQSDNQQTGEFLVTKGARGLDKKVGPLHSFFTVFFCEYNCNIIVLHIFS